MSERRDAEGESTDGDELPADVVDEAERLTRLARRAVDDAEREVYERRREELLAARGFVARVREDDAGEVLVVHPDEWLDDGVVRTDRIEDLSRGIEIPLDGAGDPDDWENVDAHNRELVDAVREAHGDVHGANAAALADFMGNHYAKPIESATADELAEFLTEYFVRNAWPSEAQREAIEESIELVFETAGEPLPEAGGQ
ncbi:DUF7108 family protein [Salinilacihabitans rarus]|uniref:DUF7108 family protein n=1 Tax=Salinilacihabitans rarus TaxID=2961596 RepID=UPI0020C87A7B|nr:rnhA operon protein [Salinilacihabitans rarus]